MALRVPRRLLLVAAAVLAAGCRLDDLLRPLPVVVLACVEWRTLTVRLSDGSTVTHRWCVRQDWVRRVDTVPDLPREAVSWR